MATDFRSYLATKDKNVLGFVGNDGMIDPTKKGYDTNRGSYLNTSATRGTVQNYVSSLYDDYQRGIADQDRASRDALTAAIRGQTANAAKLPAFDILGNYNRARTQAEASQRPHYDKKIREFLANQGVQKLQKEKEIALGREGAGIEKRYTQEDNSLNRNRTAEDVLAALQQIDTGETQFQQDEGTEFDTARRGMQESVAASGLTTSGLGQNSIGVQQDERNVQSERQTEQFQLQREAKNLFKNRTFEDLAKGDLRADEKNVLANKNFDFDLESFLQDQAQEEIQFKGQAEVDLMKDIYAATEQLESKGVAEFIAKLAGSGARSQDIALAKQVYG